MNWRAYYAVASCLGFNGATSARSWKLNTGSGAPSGTQLQWGHERALVEIGLDTGFLRGARGFNGATSARSWKYAKQLR